MIFDKALVRACLLQYAEDTWDWNHWSAFTDDSPKKGTVFEVPYLGTVLLHDYHDYDINKSYDGWAEDVWIIFDVANTLYRIKGSHTSYEGTEWEDQMEIVWPKEKVVIVYEAE